MSEINKSIIFVKHHQTRYQLDTDAQSPIDLNNQPIKSISGKEWCNATYVAFNISNQFVVILIDDDKNTLIKIQHPPESILLHVHVVETLDDNLVIFVIFTDHILHLCTFKTPLLKYILLCFNVSFMKGLRLNSCKNN